MCFIMAPIKRICIGDKLQIIKKARQGLSLKSISILFNVNKSTVSRIIAKKDVLEKLTPNKSSLKKTNARAPMFPKMETALYKWFLKQRDRHSPVGGLLLKQKASKLHQQIMENDKLFSASDGWFTGFKDRYQIRLKSVSGELLSSDFEAIEPFKLDLDQKIKELKLSKDQIYNADETALFWRMLPEKTYVSANEKCITGRKKAKERITVLLCSNASGSHKLKPLVVGKAKNPRAFKGRSVPVHYRNSSSAWMTLHMFKDWFFQCFVKEVIQLKLMCE